jgi:nucleotide-binding universal stress UspA family protein
LSEWLEWRLVMVHVADVALIPGTSVVPGAHAELREIALAQGQELLDAVVDTHDLPGTVKRRVETGGRVEGLIAVCEDEDADLLVLGSRGRGRIASALLGSVSMRVAPRAPCPVAIVPEGASLSQEALDRLERWPSPVATLAFPLSGSKYREGQYPRRMSSSFRLRRAR